MTVLTGIFFFTIFTSVYLLFFICKNEDIIKLLFNRCNTSWVLAFYYIGYRLWKLESLLFYYFSVFNDIYSNIMVYKAESIKVYKVNVGFYLDYILLSHLIASGILYNGNTAVKLI